MSMARYMKEQVCQWPDTSENRYVSDQVHQRIDTSENTYVKDQMAEIRCLGYQGTQKTGMSMTRYIREQVCQRSDDRDRVSRVPRYIRKLRRLVMPENRFISETRCI